jgi:hypothetical protein
MEKEVLAIVNLGLIDLSKKMLLTEKNILKLMSADQIYHGIMTSRLIKRRIIKEDLGYQVYKCIEQLVFSEQVKKIPSITETDIMRSIDTKNIYRFSVADMRTVFDAMKNNYELYEKMYRYKKYEIRTTDYQNYIINISSSKLLHLLGVDFYKLQNYYKNEIIRLLPELKALINVDYKAACTNQTDELLEFLRIIIEKEDRIIDAILESDKMAKAFSMHKMKTKNFAFERLGLIESPAGVVLYDKNLNNIPSSLKSDLFILRDFIKGLELHWIFNGYVPYQEEIRDAETLLIETDYSKKFEGQQISISKSVRTVNKSNFGFSINNLDYEHLMYRTPERIIRFKDKDILLEAQKILKYFPAAKINHLEDIIKNGFTNRR